MDNDTAIGLGVFALAAVLIGWIVRAFVRALGQRLGPAVQAFQQQAAQQRAALAQEGQAAARLRAAQALRPAAAAVPRPVAPGQAPRPRQAIPPPPAPARPPEHRRHGGTLLAPFSGSEGLLRSMIAAEVLGPPVSIRRPEQR